MLVIKKNLSKDFNRCLHKNISGRKKKLIGHKCNKGQEEIKIRMMSQKTKTNIPKFYYLL